MKQNHIPLTKTQYKKLYLANLVDAKQTYIHLNRLRHLHKKGVIEIQFNQVKRIQRVFEDA